MAASFKGEKFPTDRATLESLSGVGRSTAAAIAVFSSGAREAILDGNVKRVLARHFAVEGFPAAGPVEKKLWSLAESLLPERDIEAYTQGLMDLGATLCTRSRPACERCPLAVSCEARREGRVAELPTARPKKPLPHKTTVMAILIEAGRVLLVKRPPAGIWGGLLCFPEFASPRQAQTQSAQRFGCEVLEKTRLPNLAHGFTHYALTIKPVCYRVRREGTQAAEAGAVWLKLDAAKNASIPAPVRTLLERLDVAA